MATLLRRDSKFDIEPEPKRRMAHLKTKEECRLGNETIQVWTVELPSKHAEGILKYIISSTYHESSLIWYRVIKEHVAGQDTIDLQHLRRFAKPKYLPAHVLGKRDLAKEMYAVPRAWESIPSTVMQAPGSTAWEYSTPGKGKGVSQPATLHLLVCPTKIVSRKDLYDVLKECPPFSSSPDSWSYPLELREITVPLLAPTSPQQAQEWSNEYWPTFYRKTNPFGAHPTAIKKAEEELQAPSDENISVDDAFALARKAGEENRRKGIGTGTGCVIIERFEGKTEVIAVAGDARWAPRIPNIPETDPKSTRQGNMMGHAVMRAVGMVGRKRLRVATTAIAKSAAKAESNFHKGGLAVDPAARDAFFADLPITDLERTYFDKDNLKPDGYLCLRLEVFLTHEPCIMCSMGLVHSRVGRVIFKHRMPETGGLTSEMTRNDSGPVGLGYGMCWRKELNWQFMCWEYIPVEESGTVNRQSSGEFLKHEKYLPSPAENNDSEDIKSANVTVTSFARMHV
ncbi:Putative cytidine and deoxycytidylate deaminase domain, cytidine deaminase [Septoria linicola]|uniref:Cytidine and deoxycytidylate deaminase domain, cytidine deaminase n=1 Tax=Septoria linicola TaxID=215465 RepID=A0A9Q9AQ30_9PEZI|nr:putative cytidine and deoxycytidylate deaminase domain, cytidine deaminase [Septoria linicola]USW53000.1 Putative cytidine and deoxycytidylate deaminase domain, cytidine deaminase [Septoria linicola]